MKRRFQRSFLLATVLLISGLPITLAQQLGGGLSIGSVGLTERAGAASISGGGLLFGIKGFYTLDGLLSEDIDVRASGALEFGGVSRSDDGVTVDVGSLFHLLLAGDAIYTYSVSQDFSAYGGGGLRLGYGSFTRNRNLSRGSDDADFGGVFLGLGLIGGGQFSITSELGIFAEIDLSLNLLSPSEDFGNEREVSYGGFLPKLTIGVVYKI